MACRHALAGKRHGADGRESTRDAHATENAAAVVQICRQLDGIPLAIKLAARLKALPVERIAARLDELFRLLTGGSRTALPRHQTLRALIDWSYDLLNERERTLLRRLSVFAGGWLLEAAEAIGMDDVIESWEVLDLLTSLVDKSLVIYDGQAGEGRYRLLETVRQYSQDRLAESEEGQRLRALHRDWFLGVALQAEPEIWADASWLDRLERERDNLRAALDWTGAQEQGEVGLRLGHALWWFWCVRGHLGEGREYLARMLALPGAEAHTPLRAGVLGRAGLLTRNQGEYGAARALYAESLAINRELGDKENIAWALIGLGLVARDQGEYRAARALLEETLAIFRELGHRGGVAQALDSLGWAATLQGDYGSARALLEESLAISRELGFNNDVAWTLDSLGSVTRQQGEYETARALLRESLALHRELGNKRGIASSLHGLAIVTHDQGDDEAAGALLREALTVSRELGFKEGIVQDLEGLAAVAAAQSQPERAACLFGAAEGLRAAMGAPLSPAERVEHERSVTAVRIAQGEDALAAAWAEGRAMPLEQAVQYALEGPTEG